MTDAEDQPSDDSRPVPNGVSFLDRALVVVFVISLAIGALLFLVAQIQPG